MRTWGMALGIFLLAPQVAAGQSIIGEGMEPVWLAGQDRILFSALVEDQRELFTMRPDGSEVDRMTRSARSELLPSVGPDGSIAYIVPVGDNIEIWITSDPGVPGQRLDTGSLRPSFAKVTWSPDGRSLAVAGKVGDQSQPDIYRVDRDGGEPEPLVTQPGYDGEPDWAADGRLVFVSDRAGRRDLWVLDRGVERRLTDSEAEDHSPAWSPDGRRVAFVSAREGSHDVFVLDVDSGQDPIRITDGDGRSTAPSWSPDGRTLVYALLAQGRSNDTLVTIHLPVTQPGPGFYQELSWAPNGESLLVSVLDLEGHEGGLTYRIWRLDANGGGAEPITGGPRDYWTSWSPSGDRIAFASTSDQGTLDVSTMNAMGSDRQRLTVDSADDTEPAWSPDGNRIAFISHRDERAQLWLMDSDGTDQRRLLVSPGEVQNPAWSPDGSRIAYYETDGEGVDRIFVVRSDGSHPEPIAPGLWPSWTPDGQALLYSAEGGLFQMPWPGGVPTLLVPGNVIAGEMSPDGTRLACILRDGDTMKVTVLTADGRDPQTLMARPAPEW